MEIETPHAGPGEVRVRVKAAGVQPYDAAVRAGWVPQGVTGELPRVPGNEFAGVVDQVGQGVTGFAEGDEVLGFSFSTATPSTSWSARTRWRASPRGCRGRWRAA
ncbi:alcohol dehydrogenase catalytic domain-containing protein [Nonomuraea recticatena]|uniref:alcohol dehydrogenase catalytic domain-containing protein n=1 Tax=Nonomuraea recticatena TaxID=46178 RepID=UPI00361C0A47